MNIILAGQLAGMRLFIFTAIAMVAFAGNSILNRMAVGAGLIDPMTFALLRVLSGAGVLALLVVLRGGSLRLLHQPPRRAVAVLGLLAYLIGFSTAYTGLATGTGALILFGMVQITMFAGALLAGDPVPPTRWCGAAVAFAGLIVLLVPGAPSALAPWPVFAMALAGIGWGLYSLAGAGGQDPLGATAANFMLAAPLMILIWWLRAGDGLTAQGALLATMSGAITSGLGYALWYAILPDLGPSRAAVAQLTVPIIAAVGGVIVLGEDISLRFLLASALVLGGVALASRAYSALPKR